VDLPNFAFFRGRIVPYSEARVGVLTHALNYGTGCFAGIRAFWNEEERELFIFRAPEHYRRFLESSRLLRMELPYGVEELTDATVELLRREDHRRDCYIRPLAFLSEETLGVRLDGLKPEVSIVSFPFGKYLDCEAGVHATISSWRRIDDGVIPARGKISGGYVNSALAKTDAERAGFDEAILLDAAGKISEGTVANVFLIRNGVLVTPSVTDGILEGITRRTLIEFARDEGWDVEERTVDRTELFLAEEAFFAGTGVMVAPIVRVDHRPIGAGRPGERTLKLQSLFFDSARGRLPRYRRWCLPVHGKRTNLVAAG
jgi:branched-chain amino acid aminotransferase